MTDTSKREELIQVAARRLYFDHSTDRIAETAPEIMALCDQFAAIAFAVFEQAHAKELATSEEPVKNGGDSLHVEQAHTPTDDERGVLGTAIWSELAGSDISMNSVFLDRLTNTLVGVVFDSGFRRTAVPEPSAEENDDLEEVWDRAFMTGWLDRHTARPDEEGYFGPSLPLPNPYHSAKTPRICKWCHDEFTDSPGCEVSFYGHEEDAPEPQGEPTEAEIEAAKVAINLRFYRTDTRDFDAHDWDRLYREMAVAALRAAHETKGEGR